MLKIVGNFSILSGATWKIFQSYSRVTPARNPSFTPTLSAGVVVHSICTRKPVTRCRSRSFSRGIICFSEVKEEALMLGAVNGMLVQVGQSAKGLEK